MKCLGVRRPLVALALLLGSLCVAGGALAGPVAYLDASGRIYTLNHPKAVDVVSALSLLSSPPPNLPFAPALTSAIPRGTKLVSFNIEGDRAVVNFSKHLVSVDVAETRLAAIFDQVRWTIRSWGIDLDVSILVEGTPMAEYAMPTPVIEPAGDVTTAGLGGRSITLSPGHGKYWNGSSWTTARPVYCSPLNQEDYHNLELCQYLEKYLLNDGMTVKMVRCTNKNYGNSPYAGGTPWWQMGACYWLKNIGYPCTVYGSYSGCTLGSGSDESSDDIRSRPLASDYDNTNIYISIHTNGYAGDCYGSSCPRGTDTYYDCSSEHASWCTVSQNLATAVHNAVINTIRNNCDPNWVNRGTHDSNGAYGEIRIPDRAAILIELGFHDTCDYDANADHLQDNFFRSTAMWGVYKGICDYFGTTPTYGFYSSELVSHTIPSQMNAGQTYSVSVTFRNKGVLWSNKWGFKLGAVGDSDPFTSQTRHLLSSEVGPNDTYTFTFNLTAPTTPGTYTTDWRMLREGVTWFGATCSVNVNVVATDTQPPSTPTNLQAVVKSPTRVDLSWTASTDNIGVTGYKIYRNSSQIATSTTTSFSDTTCSPNTSYTYEVSAYDAAGNNSAKSSPATAVTPPSEIIIDNPACELSGVWSTGTSATDKYGSDYYYASTAVTEGKTATWRPNFGYGGSYDTYAWWPQGTNRASNAPYTVSWSGGSQVVQVNQQSGGGQWNLLLSGKTFAKGTDGFVRLSNGTGQTGYVVMADAVRWVTLSVDAVAPSVPTNLSANAVSCTQVNLTWSASTDNVAVAGYKVYRNGAQIATSTTTSYSDTDCAPSTTYSYRVSAYDTAGNDSAQSSQVTATTPADTTAPSTPTNLSANVISGTQVDLSWSASTDNIGVAGYKVYRNGAQIGTTANTTYSDTTCNPGETYTYEVSAYDAANNESAKSSPAVASTPGGDTEPPSVPTNLAANAVSGTQVDLTWSASTDNVGVTGYKIYRNGAQIGTATTTTFSDTNCVPATTYTYEVSAYDAANNESGKSSPAVATTPDTVAPSVPTNLTANAVSQNRIDLSWNASTDNVGVAGYRIYRNGSQIGTSGSTSYSDTTCDSYTTYTYQVSAYDASNNESGLSNQAVATTPANTDIILDNNVATYTGTWFTGTSSTDKYGPDYRYATTDVSDTRTAMWTPKIDIAGYYDVYCWYPKGSNRSTRAPYTVYWNGGSQRVEINQQVNGGQWVALVSSKRFSAGTSGYVVLSNGTGESSLNVMADALRFLLVSDDLTPPSTPSNLSATAVSSSQINLSWNASTDNVGVAGYKVYRNGTQVATTSATSYSDTGLAELTTYTYEVSAYDAMGNESAKSSQAVATTLDGTPPSVPTGLSASAVAPTRISLTWSASTDNVGVAGYKIYRNGGQIATSTSTSYTDTTCSPSTSYTYTVAAYDAIGNTSAQSSSASATTPAFAEVIMDNPQASFTGVWTTATSATDKYGSDYAYASTAVSEGKTATWTPNMQYSGYYDVYAWWTQGSNRATNAPYTIWWDGGSQTVAVNQSTNGGRWNVLVTNKHHVAGTSQAVKLSNGTGATGKVVVADAVRWMQVGGD